MTRADQLQDVEIDWWDGWYDGPLSGVAIYDGTAYWFEAEQLDGDAPFDPNSATRRLLLYPLTADELAAERDRARLYEEQARDKPVAAWPEALLADDHELPTKYAQRPIVGWFTAS